MPAKGDARPERQSSWLATATRARLGRSQNYVRIAFAAFVALHLGCQAYRAASAGALPEPGPESAPWFVALVLGAVWLPFLLFAVAELLGPRPALPPADPQKAQRRALAKVEPVALLMVLAFALFHGAELAWPLLTGRLLPVDVRTELIALLSSTQQGVPWHALTALFAVGAASFYAVRQLSALLTRARPSLARSALALGVLCYVLGSYAVIRCASGSLWASP